MKYKLLDPEILGAEPPSVTLSVAMIVKNEAHIVGRLFDQCNQFADEIIVVDTGSTDGTQELAASEGCIVKEFTWIDDFSAARNESFKYCTKDWIMWLDADDVIPQDTIEKIKKLKQILATDKFKPINTVFAPYNYEYTENDQLSVVLNRERFLRNGVGHAWVGRIHETLKDPWANCCKMDDIIIEHRPAQLNQDRKPGRNLRIFESYIDINKDSLRELFLFGSELAQVKRHDEALNVFKTYIERSGDKPDPVGELFGVYIKMADSFAQQQKFDEGIKASFRAIEIDPSRAEGYCCAGVIHMFAGKANCVIPFLTAATMCPIPPPHISLVVHKLYTEVPIMAMMQCMRDHLKSTDPANRFTQIAAIIRDNAAQLGIK